ncbi:MULTISPECIES: bifunctional phosphopantothenoylcysteine decarboxylase/phosphopantothenate--cysteine ligase CoaBC [Arcobacteraceae]|uniref:Coenzyme A biosynthesis bifunctional protein CoaBC n=2 Tax=Arcobacteraceae TaxID=2808963 RepID=A0ABX2YBZ7_9BACT|nr:MULTISPECIES: bifunctional phosphopantothenoylcysteine decarboxylase/phosphopantothenate--cysteine ligase CoaBC [Arcobacteraceae]OCL83428.1 Coenzyme A biosynthesis bifunctional protein CoaBC [Arcobacter porcinus]OCL92515.1 Coenzyme A biosynthesis bifunctional protein CoaBC [Arcobacter porcinus]OCL93737.1 Coenzyme A biosynthesis bifunctional protein CoaBC [Aliarcobacter thereius]OCL95145.1 Coenzyme A biosynthesis bifunctional protein CoaBC [Aliarcobacter thereius LMG 24486]QBF16865.1 phospho
MILKGKNILLGVTGSIAIYKSLELVRLYIKAGANVKVLMSEASKKFITPLTFEVISQNRALDETTENWEKNQNYNHIDITKWADIFVLAPLSANSINKIANGIADNLLLQTVLACKKPIVLAPAANTNMIENSITKESLKKINSLGFKIVDTQTKELACKDIGNGAMAEPIDVFHKTARELLKSEYWENRDAVISGGGTLEKIDEVRYISNFSSGKMASSMAMALYYKGANVKLVSTRGYENIAKNIELRVVESSKEMLDSLLYFMENANLYKKPYLFKAAAVSDYIPKKTYEGKLKKESLGDSFSLELVQNIDILNTLPKNYFYSIGFKAEMDKENAKKNAQNMLIKKSLDSVCLNILENSDSFGTSNNKIELIGKNFEQSFNGDKLNLSLEILEFFEKEYK